MRRNKLFVRAGLVLLLAVGVVNATKSVFINPADVDWEKLLDGPPKAGSDEEKKEIAQLLEWQEKRTSTDVERCKSEADADPFIFSDVLGEKFNEKSLPLTATLLKNVQSDIKNITTLVKAKWERKRPPSVDDRIKCCVPVETNGSYPSAHAVRGVVWTRILAEIFPDQKDKLLERGMLMGKDRAIAGIHFPSDVAAGQKLGTAIADKLLADPQFIEALKQAKAECEKAGIKGKE